MDLIILYYKDGSKSYAYMLLGQHPGIKNPGLQPVSSHGCASASTELSPTKCYISLISPHALIQNLRSASFCIISLIFAYQI